MLSYTFSYVVYTRKKINLLDLFLCPILRLIFNLCFFKRVRQPTSSTDNGSKYSPLINYTQPATPCGPHVGWRWARGGPHVGWRWVRSGPHMGCPAGTHMGPSKFCPVVRTGTHVGKVGPMWDQHGRPAWTHCCGPTWVSPWWAPCGSNTGPIWADKRGFTWVCPRHGFQLGPVWVPCCLLFVGFKRACPPWALPGSRMGHIWVTFGF